MTIMFDKLQTDDFGIQLHLLFRLAGFNFDRWLLWKTKTAQSDMQRILNHFKGKNLPHLSEVTGLIVFPILQESTSM